MLIGGGAPSKPGIVGHVDQQTGAVFHEPASQVRINSFIADECSDLLAVDPAQDHVLPGRELANALNQWLGEAQQGPQKNELTERNQIDLVVAKQELPVWR